MMKIVFTSKNINSPSFKFYSESLKRINDIFNGIYLSVIEDPLNINYSDYNIALFMFADASLKAKSDNPNIITAVVEPRAAQGNIFKDVNFIIVNSLEAADFFSRFNCRTLIYYTYPQVPDKLDCPINKNELILGYHGNKLHLDAMCPRITDAIEKLNTKLPVKLWAMYNVNQFGKWKKPEQKRFGFEVIHIPYDVENYAKYMAHVDIGLIPQLIPVSKSKLLLYLLGTWNRKYNERSYNYLLRFKETTNIGRHLVFAQYSIPIISDMTPSSCMYLEDECTGYLAYHTDGWYNALEKLALDKELRIKMGKNLYQKYLETASPEIQNKNLINFITDLEKQKTFK